MGPAPSPLKVCTPKAKASLRSGQKLRRLVPSEDAVALTRVDFSVAAHTIGIHNALEAGGEAVGPDEGWRHVPAGYAVSNSTHSCLALGCTGVERQKLMAQASETLEPPPRPSRD